MNKDYMIFYIFLLASSIFVASDKPQKSTTKASCVWDCRCEEYITPGSQAEKNLEEWIQRKREEGAKKYEEASVSAFVHGLVGTAVH